MSVLVFAPVQGGILKKVALEAVSFGVRLARSRQSVCSVLCSASASADTVKQLLDLGVSVNYRVDHDLSDSDSVTYYMAQAAASCGAQQIVVSNTYMGKSVAPRLAVRMGIPLASGVIDFPQASETGWEVRRSVFSNKGYANLQVQGNSCVISITPNSFATESHPSGEMKTEHMVVAKGAQEGKIRLNRVDRVAGKIPLTEAERVVSAGRGLKGPENWHLVESLASSLDAATACSKPVSDMHWRPHEEHVGQTGITIKPDLYIAIGISGAIQHLAGVSSSKVIVAINTDREAPLFKVADYGIVGDAFDVLPRLTEAVQRFRAAHV
ncbi:MAG: electron transfer flavoprotein subunit alpha/FixB family protein [Sphingomonadales bacterium]|nr:electron transfer flavoprotein subunit alpha/FixB family protein [Sphingomonadales bacterium]